MSELLVNFDTEVLQKSKETPVVVDFWAPWCGPCQILGPVIEKLAEEAQEEWFLVKVNVDNFPQVAAEYNVRGIPVVKLFIDGEVKAEFSGALPEQQIKHWLKQHIPDEVDKEVNRIVSLLQEDKTEEIERELRKILDKYPTHAKASFNLGRLLILKETEQAVQYLISAEKTPEFVQEVITLKRFAEILLLSHSPEKLEESSVKPILLEALQAALNGQLANSIELLIDVIVKNKSYENEVAREACIGLFVLLGPQHELTKKYRKRFDMALY